LSNFARRTFTAVWIVVFILGGFWLHPISFFFTGLLIIAGAQYEYYLVVRDSGVHPQIAAGLVTGIALYSVSSLVAAGFTGQRSYLYLLPLIAIIMVIELYRKQDKPFDSLAHTFFAVIYIAVPLSLFPYAAFSKTGLDSLLPNETVGFSPGIIIGFLLILWANDTGAYITGVSLGRHRLMERISPKKSWEGFFGGGIIAILAAWLLSGWLGVVGKTEWIMIAVLVTVAGTFGDLVESMFKRSAGVKDTGTIMPGHGGFLDRFDSAFLSFPIVYLFISLFG
jgi:phosphatidate cytidylyltransferase